MRKNKQAFTLIELLVVVLIIGILAAVALPQYWKAVDRSRFAPILSTTRNIFRQMEFFYMSEGKYPEGWLSLPLDAISCPPATTNYRWDCGTWKGAPVIYLYGSNSQEGGNGYFLITAGKTRLFYYPAYWQNERAGGVPLCGA